MRVTKFFLDLTRYHNATSVPKFKALDKSKAKSL